MSYKFCHLVLAFFTFLTLTMSAHTTTFIVDAGESATAILHCSEQMRRLLDDSSNFIKFVYADRENLEHYVSKTYYTYKTGVRQRSKIGEPTIDGPALKIIKTVTPAPAGLCGVQPIVTWECHIE